MGVGMYWGMLPLRWFRKYRAARKNTVSTVFAFSWLKVRRGQGNRVLSAGLRPAMASRCRIKLSGSNNTIELGDIRIDGTLKISIGGSDNHVVLRNGVYVVDSLEINLWKECTDASVEIGSDTSFWETIIRNYDSGSSVKIGEDCMFSKQTVVSNTDEHAILQDGKVINRGGALAVGNHVWVGQGASMMKNCTIPDGCVVARNAIVSRGRFPRHAVLAGMPARAVKENVEWTRASVNEFV